MLYRRTARLDQEDTPTLHPLTLSLTRAGKFKAVAEYVDLETGEIIPGSALAPALRVGEKMEARDGILGGLRPEVRAFAEFVLRFANRRRGITPEIGELCHWYAEITGKRADHVRRFIKPLKAAKVLANDSLLGQAFQRTGGNVRDHLSEAENAHARFSLMRSMVKPLESLASVGNRKCPAQLVASEVAAAEAEMLAEQAAWKAQRSASLGVSPTSTLWEPA